MTEHERLVKMYLRIELDADDADAYRAAMVELLMRWQQGLDVQAFEVKEDCRDISYYAEIESTEYREAFTDYHRTHGWNVDEVKLLGLSVEDETLEAYQISWTADPHDDEAEVRIFWQRPGRDDEMKSLDCWLIKYDGAPTNRQGEPSAVEDLDDDSGIVYRRGLLFCGRSNPELRAKLTRLSFKWERFLRESGITFARADNFSDFD